MAHSAEARADSRVRKRPASAIANVTEPAAIGDLRVAEDGAYASVATVTT